MGKFKSSYKNFGAFFVFQRVSSRPYIKDEANIKINIIVIKHSNCDTFSKEHRKKTQNNILGYSLLPLSIDPDLCSLPSHSKIVIEISNFPKVCQGLVRYCCEEDGPINCVVQPNTFPVRDADVGYITLRIAGDLERPWGQQ